MPGDCQIDKKHGNALVRNLRKTYGQDFASAVRGKQHRGEQSSRDAAIASPLRERNGDLR